MSTGHKTCTLFLWGDRMKVTNTSITDKEISEVLSQAGLDDKQIKAFFRGAVGQLRMIRSVDKIQKKIPLLRNQTLEECG